MISSIFPSRKKKEPFELQLTAMIDVFSMIVIFLIFGTVFGAADMVVPKDMRIPKSLSKEGIDSAPRIMVQTDAVSFSLENSSIPITEFKTLEGRKRVEDSLKNTVAEYQKRRKDAVGSGITPINLVADESAHYEDVYDVISVFRKLGFDSIFFVATGGGKKQ